MTTLAPEKNSPNSKPQPPKALPQAEEAGATKPASHLTVNTDAAQDENNGPGLVVAIAKACVASHKDVLGQQSLNAPQPEVRKEKPKGKRAREEVANTGLAKRTKKAKAVIAEPVEAEVGMGRGSRKRRPSAHVIAALES